MPHLARGVTLALVSGLMVLGLGLWSPASAVQAKESHPEWGGTSAADGVLRRSCRDYRYRYAITPPKGDWGLETFLVGPGRVHLASDAMVVGTDPLSGHDTFRVCRPSTRPGVFKIKALLSVQDASGQDYVDGWLPVTRFRLRLPR